jgi:ATP-dependent Lhr-like helicase
VLGALPTQRRIVMERFFDESGGMQLVIHSPHGSRLNRAWGLALRKRFCRQFNFELQAAATEDAIQLSLSTRHSFRARRGRALPALGDRAARADAGAARRAAVRRALALERDHRARAAALSRRQKVAPQLQRMKSQDLLAAVFPDQVACAENLPARARSRPSAGRADPARLPRRRDGRDRLAAVLRGIERATDRGRLPRPAGAVAVRRRGAVGAAVRVPRRRAARGAPHAGGAEPALCRSGQRRRPRPLDPDAIDSVRQEAWPRVRSADEMHEALHALGVVTEGEAAATEGWRGALEQLAQASRATRSTRLDAGESAPGLWVAPSGCRSCACCIPMR